MMKVRFLKGGHQFQNVQKKKSLRFLQFLEFVEARENHIEEGFLSLTLNPKVNFKVLLFLSDAKEFR